MTVVDLSRNEFVSSVQKACQGVGADAALASDIAMGCLELRAAGLESLSHLLPLLQNTKPDRAGPSHEPYAHSQNGYFTPDVTLLRNGSSVMDHLCLATVTVGACDDCVLLAAMIQNGCAMRGRFTRIIAPGIGWSVLDHAYLAAAPGRLTGPLTFRFVPVDDHGDLAYPPAQSRVLVPVKLWADLQKAAAAVLVPADDATRLRDAGAGLNDND